MPQQSRKLICSQQVLNLVLVFKKETIPLYQELFYHKIKIVSI
jgi:hypothetical protein